MIVTAEQVLAEAVFGQKNGNFPPEQEDILEGAISSATTVLEKDPLTGTELAEAIEALQDALDAFNDLQISIDYTPLTELIETAEDIIGDADEGDGNGQYPRSAIDQLQAAIDTAKAVAADQDLTQQELDDNIDTLQNAIDVFNDSVITISIDELNNAIKTGER